MSEIESGEGGVRMTLPATTYSTVADSNSFMTWRHPPRWEKKVKLKMRMDAFSCRNAQRQQGRPT